MELQEETRRRIGEEEAWFRQQTLLLEAEERRRRLAAEEEQRLEEQRRRLAAVHRELRAKELALLEATRRRELGFCQRRKEAEIARLDDHIRRTVWSPCSLRFPHPSPHVVSYLSFVWQASLRDTETQAAIDEAEARNMELQLQRKMLEQVRSLDRCSKHALGPVCHHDTHYRKCSESLQKETSKCAATLRFVIGSERQKPK